MNMVIPPNRTGMTALLLIAALSMGSARAEPTATEMEPSPFAGTWYLRMRTATDAKIPIIGTTHIKSTTNLLTTITVKDGALMQRQKTCIVDSRPSRSITRTVLPQTFIDHLPVKTYPIKLRQGDDGTWQYRADLKQQFVGYDGKKANGKIPESTADPSVFDWDEDGDPGASVLINVPLFGKVRIYLVQTNHTILTGRAISPDRIEGTTRQLLLQQRTIGASNRLLAANPKLTIGTGHNSFEMMRTKDGANCNDIAILAKGTF